MRLIHQSSGCQNCQGKSPRRGISRIEVLVLVACGMTLLGLAIPAILQGRAAARSRQCGMRQFRMAIAFQRFEQEFERLPGWRELQAVDAQGQERATSWVFPLLPFLATTDEGSSPMTPSSFDAETSETQKPAADPSLPSPVSPSLLALYEAYGPAGPDRTRGLPPQEEIVDLICPESALGWSAEIRPVGPLSWRVNTGLPDAPRTSLDSAIPADWPANGAMLDRFSDRSDRSISSLRTIESHDGANHTLLIVESVQPTPWSSSTEPELGVVAGWPLDPTEPSETIGQFERWFWCGLGRADESPRSGGWRRGSSRHVEGIQVTFGSGATSMFSPDIDPWLWAQLTFSHDEQARFPGTEIAIVRPRPAAVSAVPTLSPESQTPAPEPSADGSSR